MRLVNPSHVWRTLRELRYVLSVRRQYENHHPESLTQALRLFFEDQGLHLAIARAAVPSDKNSASICVVIEPFVCVLLSRLTSEGAVVHAHELASFRRDRDEMP